MKTRVLDSWPVLEWIKSGSPAADFVDVMLSDAEAGRIRLLMSAINAGEVYYFLGRHHSSSLAEFWRESSRTLPVTMEVPSAEDIWSAASLKARFAISYADAFAAALAQKYGCPLVTGDPEFLCVDRLTIDWIGRA
ncbi:MAG: PIN domain-containing protein [Bryobacteraceae bacterium]